MNQYTSRLAKSEDRSTHTTDASSAKAATSGTLPNFVQEAIHNFNEQASKKPPVQYRQWSGITWSKWDVRPKGVKESVAQVIPQPSVSVLSKRETSEGIQVEKVNPYCMDALLAALSSVESSRDPSHQQQ